MATIPHFQLYGESGSFGDPGFVHIETIASRSSLNDWEIRPHSHDTLDQLLIIRAGRVAVQIEERGEVLTGPAVIHVPASTVHGFTFDDDVKGDVLTFSVELRGSLKSGQPAPITFADPALACAIGAPLLARVDPLLDQLRMECSGHDEGRIAASAWLVGLILLYVGRITRGEGSAPSANQRAIRFRQLVDRHFREHRSLATYAEALGITERSLTRLTRTWFGCTPVHYLHQRLLLEAQRQLVYGSQPIARIAEELGFPDASYFTRFYRRMTGSVPSLIRRSG